MPSDIVKRLLESADAQLVDEPVTKKSSKKRKLKPEKPCSEETIVKAHIRSLFVLDRKLAASHSQATTTSALLKKKKYNDPPPSFGRTSATQAAVVHEPTFNKRRHAKETKKKQLRDIAKLLKRSEK
jgi:hypothetical protein